MLLSQIDLNKSGVTDEQADEIVFGKLYDGTEKSDYAIVLGTSPEYAAARADIAASFYKKSGTDKFIVSGAAVADKTITESAFLKKELIARGVPADLIIEESHALDTIQNMTCSLTEICKNTNIMEVKSVTVITEPFHMRRSLAFARLLLPNFIEVRGYTEGTDEQRARWKNDKRLRKCVLFEIEILRLLIIENRIPDIEI